jgi:hypothetical protein
MFNTAKRDIAAVDLGARNQSGGRAMISRLPARLSSRRGLLERAEQCRLEIEAAEPPIYWVVEADCYNEPAIACGSAARPPVRLSFLQRIYTKLGAGPVAGGAAGLSDRDWQRAR